MGETCDLGRSGLDFRLWRFVVENRVPRRVVMARACMGILGMAILISAVLFAEAGEGDDLGEWVYFAHR